MSSKKPSTEFKGPIVAGAWYALGDDEMVGRAVPRTEYFSYGTRESFTICGFGYFPDGRPCRGSSSKIRQVFIVQKDPELLVAELQKRGDEEIRGEAKEAYYDTVDLLTQLIGAGE